MSAVDMFGGVEWLGHGGSHTVGPSAVGWGVRADRLRVDSILLLQDKVSDRGLVCVGHLGLAAHHTDHRRPALARFEGRSAEAVGVINDRDRSGGDLNLGGDM